MAYIFGGDTGATPETIKRRREIAAALARGASGRAPRDVGEGLSAVGQAIAYRMAVAKADAAEKAGVAGANEAFGGLMGSFAGPAPGVSDAGAPAPSGGGSPYADAIAKIESGGRYDAIGPATRSGDRAYGKYQVMGSNVGPWTKEILGREMGPAEFAASPEAQEAVFKAKFGSYVAKTGSPQDAASMWFTGKPLAQGANRRDVTGTSGADYVAKFTAEMGKYPQVANHGSRGDPTTMSLDNADMSATDLLEDLIHPTRPMEMAPPEGPLAGPVDRPGDMSLPNTTTIAPQQPSPVVGGGQSTVMQQPAPQPAPVLPVPAAGPQSPVGGPLNTAIPPDRVTAIDPQYGVGNIADDPAFPPQPRPNMARAGNVPIPMARPDLGPPAYPVAGNFGSGAPGAPAAEPAPAGGDPRASVARALMEPRQSYGDPGETYFGGSMGGASFGAGAPEPEANRQAVVSALTGGGAPQPAPGRPASPVAADGASAGAPGPAGGLDPRLVAVLSHPFASDGQKAVAMAMLKQQMEATKPVDPVSVSEGSSLVDPRTGKVVFGGQPKTTDDIREYQFYREQGGTLPFDQFMREMKKAGASSVNVDTRQENEFGKTLGKKLAEQYVEIQQGAQSARAKIATLEGLKQALGQSSYTGVGAEALLTLRQAAKALNIDVGDLGPEESARAIGNQLALQLRNPSGGAGMPGAMSDKDREFLVASVPGLTKTPQGNARLVDYMARVERRSIEVADLANQYMQTHGGQLDAGFYEELSKWSQANPLFADEQAAPPAAGQPKRLRYNPATGELE
jgi:hypothetical protein